MSAWYLKRTSGEIYGPVELAVLVAWAQDGRIAPEDELSQDQTSWQPPSALPELELHYEILLEDDTPYGPVHVLVLGELLLGGDIQSTTPVRHVTTLETRSVTAWLVPHLIQRHGADATEITALKSKLDSAERRLTNAEAMTASPPEAAPVDVRDIPKEVLKWQRLYETEKAHRLDAENRLTRQVAELKADLQAAYSERDRLVYRASQAERMAKRLQSTDETTTTSGTSSEKASHNIEESYQHLLDHHENLLNELQQKNEELSRLRSARPVQSESAGERIKELELELETERNSRDEALARLADLEQSHVTLLKSYREMNDRFIRMRDQVK